MKPGARERYLLASVRLAERMLADFADSQHGGFFTTATGHEALIMRSREGQTGPRPAATRVAALVLARLSSHFAWRISRGRDRCRSRLWLSRLRATRGHSPRASSVDFLSEWACGDCVGRAAGIKGWSLYGPP